MHGAEFWAIAERDHAIQNPSSPEKLLLLADYCRVRDGMRVLDVGCGKGWLLRAWASRWAIRGVGLEINPAFVAVARAQAEAVGVADRLTLVEGPALAYTPQPGGYDIVTCVGASFALGSFDEAVAWMRRALKPGGALAIGEPFVRETPAAGSASAPYRDLAGTAAALERQGLALRGLIEAAPDDWDRYLSQQWRAVEEWAAEQPEHPERGAMLRTVAAARERYLRWERRYIGWAIFVAAPRLD